MPWMAVSATISPTLMWPLAVAANSTDGLHQQDELADLHDAQPVPAVGGGAGNRRDQDHREEVGERHDAEPEARTRSIARSASRPRSAPSTCRSATPRCRANRCRSWRSAAEARSGACAGDRQSAFVGHERPSLKFCPMCSRKNFASSPMSLSPQPCATAADSAVSTPDDSGMAGADSAPVATADMMSLRSVLRSSVMSAGSPASELLLAGEPAVRGRRLAEHVEHLLQRQPLADAERERFRRWPG